MGLRLERSWSAVQRVTMVDLLGMEVVHYISFQLRARDLFHGGKPPDPHSSLRSSLDLCSG